MGKPASSRHVHGKIHFANLPVSFVWVTENILQKDDSLFPSAHIPLRADYV